MDLGYAKYGVDSAETSWRIVENVQHYVGQTTCPKELLVKAYKKIIDNKVSTTLVTFSFLTRFEIFIRKSHMAALQRV